MSSRMDRYYKEESENKRTTKNSSLYDDIYDDRNYDSISSSVNDINVDTLATSSGKQIDIREVKALLDKREEFQKSRQIVKDIPQTSKDIEYHDEVNKVYDINDMLEKAKETQKEEDRPRSLNDTQTLTLQELINGKEYSKKSSLNEHEVKDLIDTLYKTNLLKNSEGDGILDDLKATGNTIIEPDLKEVINDKKEPDIDDTSNLDKSFYTSSLGFKTSDFVSLNEIDSKVSKNNKLITFLLVFLVIIFVILITYIIIKFVI